MTNPRQEVAFHRIEATITQTQTAINNFCREVFRTRGGRIGSGMGGVLEALWGYYTNEQLGRDSPNEIELAWFQENQFHDFACVVTESEWIPATKQGEFFRIEAKSMNEDADESKAHFDVLTDELEPFDALVLLVWRWHRVDRWHVTPLVVDVFFGSAIPVARLRDQLHLARGGTFVDRHSCPDACVPSQCQHHGEPLNANGTRERITGPESCKGPNISFAANFGGMIRMLKTKSRAARESLRSERRRDEVAHRYISFIHKNFPKEELAHYLANDWRRLAASLKIQPDGEIHELQKSIRKNPVYPQALRDFT